MTPVRQLSSAMLAASLAMSAVALADDYRAEVRLTGNLNEFDDDTGDVDVINATGTYYLESVTTDNLPLAEAAFLNRSSYVNVTASHFDQEGEGNAEAFGANIGYYLPDTILFGRLGVTRVDLGDGADVRWHGTFGVTPIEHVRPVASSTARWMQAAIVLARSQTSCAPGSSPASTRSVKSM